MDASRTASLRAFPAAPLRLAVVVDQGEAWERDELGDLGEETHEQYALRDQAGDLALIGLVISERGRWEGEGVVIGLDVVFAGAAVRASL
ncbi:hypothetical protein OG978_46300 (plasmid) [Streptomyces sp. NBC_01591]|uniref:hypothetical protein n=1 Tax=Streptomyces sp. NBC_01591 TaxID=2975888 RepID=UPI002DDB5957|nr:hypothetical protein [Streptomyces sp. NBC_01591]WSD74443.1 hypothetical protein OG978_46300 [Streptomyces sp. NBC_01591]